MYVVKKISARKAEFPDVHKKGNVLNMIFRYSFHIQLFAFSMKTPPRPKQIFLLQSGCLQLYLEMHLPRFLLMNMAGFCVPAYILAYCIAAMLKHTVDHLIKCQTELKYKYEICTAGCS